MFSTSPARQRHRTTVTAASVVVFALLAAAGCGAESDPVDLTSTRSKTVGAAAARTTISYGFSGAPQSFTVPDGVTTLAVTIAGGAGGWDTTTNPDRINYAEGGPGLAASGLLPVTPSETLTIGVGGGGDAAQGNKAPGAGGWGLPSKRDKVDGDPDKGNYEQFVTRLAGGSGGTGHGLATGDGSGGGGASAIRRGETDVVIAGGGGGGGGYVAMGPILGTSAHKGGAAGNNVGENGSSSTGVREGRGATTTLTQLGSPGIGLSSGSGSGGGGGGGGRYNGEGGDKSSNAASGGGGGNSLLTNLVNPVVTNNPTSGADGQIKLSWVRPIAPTKYRLSAVDSALPYESFMTGNPEGNSEVDGSAVQLARSSSYGQDPRQHWVFTPDAATGTRGKLVNGIAGRCLEVNGSTGAVDEWTCEGGDNQEWTMLPTVDGRVQFSMNFTEKWGTETRYLAWNSQHADLDVVTTPSSTAKTAWTATLQS